MISNGYKLTVPVALRLYELHAYEYHITLDGLKETHNKQRCLAHGSGTWHVIVDNLKKLKDGLIRTHISILLRTNITKPIYANLDEFIKFLSKEFGYRRMFSLEWRFAVDMGGKRVNEIKKEFIKNENYAKKLLGYQSDAMNRGLYFTSGISILKPAGVVCYACKKSSYIVGSDGAIYKCTDAFHLDTGVVGMLVDDGEMKLDPDKEAYWTEMTKSKEVSKCVNCNVRPICLASNCSLRRHRNNEAAMCPEIKYSLEEYIKFYSKDSYLCRRYS